MHEEGKATGLRRYLTTGLAAVALTAAIVPSIAFAEDINETILLNNTETLGENTETLGEMSDAPSADEGGSPATDDQAPQVITFPTHEWTGTKVAPGTGTCEAALPLPDDGKLTGGWYILDTDKSFGERVMVTGDTQLILGEGKTLDATAGIYVQQGTTLTIYALGDGSGRIVSTAETGAGIGAYHSHKGGDIVIHGGHIEATGGNHCAGIGSNDDDRTDVGSITIYDGDVTATGGGSGAGIGGGRASTGGHIYIYGGTVTAQGGHYAAGIGGGNGQDHPVKGAHAGTIEIRGGTVTSTGGDDGAGIGGGEDGNAGEIRIYDGTVTAQGGNNGAGIGCGEGEASDSDGGNVTISGGLVYAYAGNWSAGIGGGRDSRCETINIEGGTIHAHADKTINDKTCQNGAAIGGGSNESSGQITISGGDIEALASNDGAAIGGGDHADSDTITISGGTIVATATNGAGIGGGQHCGDGGTTTISGGDVTATSTMGAGIGGGKGWYDSSIKTLFSSGVHGSGDGGDITISGGDVKATSKQYYAIGAGGWDIKKWSDKFDEKAIGSAGTTRITQDATVTAKGGIGAFGGDGGKVNIEGGHVTAVGTRSDLVLYSNHDGEWPTKDHLGSAFNFLSKKATVSLYPDACVRAGNDEKSASIQASGKRMAACRDKHTHYLVIEPCTHDELMQKAEDDARFIGTCPHCGAKIIIENEPDADPAGDVEHATPTLLSVEPIPDGRIGLRFRAEIPQSEECPWQDGLMEFVVDGKGGRCHTVRCADAGKRGANEFYFDCPLSAIEIADEVSASYRCDTHEAPMATTSLSACLARMADEAGEETPDASVDFAHALMNYGHYTQRMLSAANGWKLGENGAHTAVEPSMQYTDATVDDARRELSKLSPLQKHKGDTVTAITLSLHLDSEASMQMFFETDEDIVSAVIDGQTVTKDAFQRVKGGWSVTFDHICPQQLVETHSVEITTTGKGDTSAYLQDCSALTYADAILNSKKCADDTDTLYAAAALYNYHRASLAL